MIVIEEDGANVKTAQARQVSTEDGMLESSQLLSGPPPSYSASTSHEVPYNAPLQYPDDVPAHPHHERRVYGENARRRFLKAFMVAIGIWLLIAILAQSFEAIFVVQHKSPKDKPSGDKKQPENSDGKNPKSDSRIRSPLCVVFPPESTPPNRPSPNAPYSATFGFSLPIASDFAFFANDSYSLGTFHVDAVESSSSEVEVDVVVLYRNPKTIQHSKVCLFEKGAERSIGIKSITSNVGVSSGSRLPHYDIYVRFPSPVSNKHPLQISRLAADFTSFAIRIGNLAGRAEFAEIDLKTKYEVIETAFLSARKARLETSQAAIRGNYITSSSLEIVTSNAPIEADISMHSTTSHDQPPTDLVLQTKNAGITARLNLLNPSTVSSPSSISPSTTNGDSVGGNFNILSTTSNSDLVLSVISQPYSSFVSLSAHTSNAATDVSLPLQFSGTFRLATSVLRPVLDAPPKEDRGRRREVEVTREESHLLEGSVTWVDKRGRADRGGGFVDVKTSILPAILRL